MTPGKTKILSAAITCLLSSMAITAAALPPPPPAVEITVTDSMSPFDDLLVPFGNITEGSFSNSTVTVTNDGNSELVIGSMALADPLINEFTILNDNCSGQIIIASGSCTFTVSFSPASPGTFSDTFDIPSNDPDEDPVTVTVSGKGLSSAANNPPSSFKLIAPEKNQNALGKTVKLKWEKASDPDGDSVTYDVYVCEDSGLTAGCITATDIALIRNEGVYFAGIGGHGTAALLPGMALFLIGSGIRRKKLLILTVITAAALMVLISCGGGGGTSGGNTKSTVSSDEIVYTLSGLSPATTYYWKVVAADGYGGETDSEVWNFDTL